MKRHGFILFVLILLSPIISAQGEPKLSDVVKLQLISASKDIQSASTNIELWQLKLEKAQQAMQKLVNESTPKGYQITQQLELVKLPESKEKAP